MRCGVQLDPRLAEQVGDESPAISFYSVTLDRAGVIADGHRRVVHRGGRLSRALCLPI
jgi:hypothetical protein